MIRKAFLMTLRPGCEAEYEQRHSPIWPELETILSDYGVWSYSIFLNRENNQLFAYVEIESETTWPQIAQTETCQKWWAHMKDLMLTNNDNSPTVIDLNEVFHLD
jgi:L-rhamnose mutarotase